MQRRLVQLLRPLAKRTSATWHPISQLQHSQLRRIDRKEIRRRKEAQVRNLFAEDEAINVEDVVGEIIRARNEIWDGRSGDKRTANTDTQEKEAKRQKLNNGEAAPLPVYATKFDEAELAAEERRPKKKVAVMLGYSGTGYKGMQLAPDQKTIEGDLFKAFVEAGAISKANADDPKKSSFVRCARTDKGVHAAGNIISLKLIVEDENIVNKINEHLTPQIRVWGFERTNNSFSAYQLVDSRIYEYLIPTHTLLPPHPRSFLGRKCRDWAERKGELEAWEQRQAEVRGYWDQVDEEMVRPILQDYPDDIRSVLEKALWLTAEQEANRHGDDGSARPSKKPKTVQTAPDSEDAALDKAGETTDAITHSTAQEVEQSAKEVSQEQPSAEPQSNGGTQEQVLVDKPSNTEEAAIKTEQPAQDMEPEKSLQPQLQPSEPQPELTKEQRIAKEQRVARRKLIDDGVKRLRAAYVTAKRKYRVPDQRKQRLQDVLNLYLGTRNFWNYTINKPFRDPSAKRVIRSFNVNFEPILIDGTEWLSLKVHGQSFMMHQIRKMVGMAALIVRCGCDPVRITESYGPGNFSIPKAPSLGLLLERPIFDSYNKRAKADLQKEPIDFDKYKTEMDAFKQKFIYERMYEDEERENVFGNFFNHVDNFPSNTFLFVTSGGLEASGEIDGPDTGAAPVLAAPEEDDDEDDAVGHTVNMADLDSDDELDKLKDNAGDEG
ncbi:tRNA pseudouridine synthase 1 [Lithohypha guttulata]|uniref:tRNA pseudouridine synthase 1 n=1 Tax=Lithohypha guttulata TaxID=1690604 RepID=UPI002DE15F03|nr:tRNA pseudouridine synthase 1 [Lithohypha guttulata]